jgi:transposase
MGESPSEKLDFIPVKVKVIERVRLKFSCRRCGKEKASIKIKSAPVPSTRLLMDLIHLHC